MNIIRIGPANNVPKIKNKIDSVSFACFFARNVSPTSTGKIVSNKKKSYLSSGPKVARPIKNLEESMCITFGYIVSAENMTMVEIPIIIPYDAIKANFFFVDNDVLAAKNNVIMK